MGKTFRSILYTDVPLNVTLSIPVILVAAAISMLTILISAYIPARKAVNIPVMECIRQSNEVKVESKIIKTSVLAQYLYGLEGTLALKNFKRNKKRYRSIVLSLVLSVVLFVSASSFVTALKQVSAGTEELTTYDIAFAARDMEDSELLLRYEKMKTVEGVYASSYQMLVSFFSKAKLDDMTDEYRNYASAYASEGVAQLSMQIQFLEDATYHSILADLGLPIEEYSGQDGNLIAVAKINASGETMDLFTHSSMTFSIVPQTDDCVEFGQEIDVTITFVDTIPILEEAEATPVFFM